MSAATDNLPQIASTLPGSERETSVEPAEKRPVRVLYSFPHRIGRPRIALTAWQQVTEAARAGAQMHVFPASVVVPFDDTIQVSPSLAFGPVRLPFRLIGDSRMFELHDRIVARRLKSLSNEVDVVHAWPLGARETLKTAKELGIPTVLERPNAHTRFAYNAVQAESDRLGVVLPPDHEHAFDADILAREEEEYELADRLLCPSEFVAKTFLDEGFPRAKLLRHVYGYDETRFFSEPSNTTPSRPFTMIFVGVAAVRKGLHFALEAWLKSRAHEHGVFQIAGEILPGYAEKLSPMLAHPSVHPLGHRDDVPGLMRTSDVFVLPSIEEGFALAPVEAIGSGCVPLLSDACSEACRHMETGLVHHVGDVETLTDQITMLYEDPGLLSRLRRGALDSAQGLTWTRAGVRLAEIYCEVAEP